MATRGAGSAARYLNVSEERDVAASLLRVLSGDRSAVALNVLPSATGYRCLGLYYWTFGTSGPFQGSCSALRICMSQKPLMLSVLLLCSSLCNLVVGVTDASGVIKRPSLKQIS